MGTWLVPREELTTEQLRAVELGIEEHRLLLGGPGSGKTQVLVHRAEHLCAELSISVERLRIFVYTNVLAEYIRSGVDLLGLPQGCVSTLDHWCREYYETTTGRRAPRGQDAGGKKGWLPDFAAIREGVRQLLEQSGTEPPYDAILVDEGQDLDADALAILPLMARHVTVCLDHNQQIYDSGSGCDEALRSLGIRRHNLTLLETFRCCPYIVDIASEFVSNPHERRAYIEQTRTTNTDIETPVLYYADGFEDEKAKLITTLRVRIAMGERIAILLPQKRQVHGFAKGLREEGFEVETQSDLDFESDAPKLITYHSAKGLTFDTVLLPRLTKHSFFNQSMERIERLLFVGITRATKWVYLSTSVDSFEPMDRLALLESQKQITVQRGTTDSQDPTTNETAIAPEDDLDFL